MNITSHYTDLFFQIIIHLTKWKCPRWRSFSLHLESSFISDLGLSRDSWIILFCNEQNFEKPCDSRFENLSTSPLINSIWKSSGSASPSKTLGKITHWAVSHSVSILAFLFIKTNVDFTSTHAPGSVLTAFLPQAGPSCAAAAQCAHQKHAGPNK